MSFYEELKRRNVAKVAVLYVIAAWLLLQVTDVLSSLLTVPEWTGSLVVLLLLLGFFPVVIFSWVYEMTPEGLKKEKDIDRSQSITPETGRKINTLIIVLLVLAIGGLIADRLMPEKAAVAETPAIEEDEQTDVVGSTGLTATSSAPDRSIAVLPFVNMSSDIEQEYFSDGLSEELLNLLAKIPELQVTSRSSAFAFKGEKIDIPVVAQKLNVAHILEGSVRKSGDQVRITAQLIEARSDTHLWSETYDRKLDDVFAIQDEIAAAVVTQLKVTLLGDVPTVQAIDPEAYSLFLQARYFRYQSTRESYEKAAALFEQALAIDPNYAAAWAGLGEVYFIQAANALIPMDEGRRLASEFANKALEIDPAYAPAHAVLGMINSDDLAAAARHVERALALAPTDLDILRRASSILRTLGRMDEGIALQEYVVARDPVSPLAHNDLGLLYLYASRLDDALLRFQTVLDLNPLFYSIHYKIGETLLFQGEPEAALAAFEQEETDEEYRVKGMALASNALGRQAEFEDAFSELRERWGEQWPSEVAHVYAWTGDADAAFEWLDKSISQKEDGLADQFLRPWYTPLHDDPRWFAFRERTGTSKAQLAAIEFEVSIPE